MLSKKDLEKMVEDLSKEVESLKKSQPSEVGKLRVPGLAEFLQRLYQESDDVDTRKKILSWLKNL